MQVNQEADVVFDNEAYPYFNIKHFGTQKCSPCHEYGPAMRSYNLIHYILKGKGKFIINQKTYELEAGSGFFIPPNEVTYYQADAEDPWEYVWVGFEGMYSEKYFKQADITVENPVFTDPSEYTKNLFREIADCAFLEKNTLNMRVTGLVMLFFSQILLQTQPENIKLKSGETYVNHALEYIENNYWHKISMDELAHHININRTYLCKLFKKYTGISPNQYILKVKMERAKEFLHDPRLKISDIARSVGYDDLFTFSKAYKRIMGHAPSFYKLTVNKD